MPKHWENLSPILLFLTANCLSTVTINLKHFLRPNHQQHISVSTLSLLLCRQYVKQLQGWRIINFSEPGMKLCAHNTIQISCVRVQARTGTVRGWRTKSYGIWNCTQTQLRFQSSCTGKNVLRVEANWIWNCTHITTQISVFLCSPLGLTFTWWGCCGLCLYQPNLPILSYSVLVSASVFVTLSTVFHSINSPNNFPLSKSVLPVLFLSYWSFQLYISLWKSPSALI